MKKLTLHFICIFCFLSLLSCVSGRDNDVGTPKIQAGVAKLTGKIKSPKNNITDSSFVEIFVPHPVTGEVQKSRTPIDQSGRFSIDVDVETDVSLIALHTSLKPHNSIYVKIRSAKVTDLNIAYNQDMEIDEVSSKPEMSKDDMIESVNVVIKMLGIYDDSSEPIVTLYDKSPEAYPNHVKKMVSEKLAMLDADSLVSKEVKEILAKDYRIWRYSLGLFEYERAMKFNFWQVTKDSITVPKLQKIDRSYFEFLKELDLNNPQYLLAASFSDFQIQMLKNKTLALPEIGEQDIPSWLASVKAILSDLVGFKDGQYYDILAANAYGRQLIKETRPVNGEKNEALRPLTEQQKKNIADYWKDGEIAKILLRKNDEVMGK